MSTTTKKTSVKGVRYTDAQKKEVVDFAVNYNEANGRGGQSKAAEKYKISQITVATWLKAAGAPAAKAGNGNKSAKTPKAAKVAKAAKAPKAAKNAGKGKPGTRYTDEQKKAVTDFVVSYNAENGRGGASTASKKFSVSPLTVVSWLKAAGGKGSARKLAKKAARKGARARTSSAPAAGGFSAKLTSLLTMSGLIDKAEAELAILKAKFTSLKASL